MDDSKSPNSDRACTSGSKLRTIRRRNEFADVTDLTDVICPRCGHVHQGAVACGEDLGDGRICRCELPVPA